MTNSRVLLVLGILSVSFIAGCGPQKKPMQQEYPNAQTFSGTLRNVKQLVGGSPTGWELHVPTGVGRSVDVLPLDMSDVQTDATMLDGQNVTIKVIGRRDGAYVVRSMRQTNQ